MTADTPEPVPDQRRIRREITGTPGAQCPPGLPTASAIDPRYRALLLLAVFGSLRWGELAALRRTDVDLAAHTVRAPRQLAELPGGGFGFAPPKSDAGKRVVVIPAVIMPIVREHVERMDADDDQLIFTSPEGAPLRHPELPATGLAPGAPVC